MKVWYMDRYVECTFYDELEKYKYMLEDGLVYDVRFTSPRSHEGGSQCMAVYNESKDMITVLRDPKTTHKSWYSKLPGQQSKETLDRGLWGGYLTEENYFEFMEKK